LIDVHEGYTYGSLDTIACSEDANAAIDVLGCNCGLPQQRKGQIVVDAFPLPSL
jgi:hypothetical protein